MLELQIPGRADLNLRHLVLDYNGTLACDGRLIDGVAERLRAIASHLRIHVLTADTFGEAASQLADAPCELYVLPPDRQDERKLDYIKKLGPTSVVAVGNGMNDRLMLDAAGLGIAVTQTEGAAGATLAAADVIAPTILAALDLLLNPKRLVATLRI